ncbi:MAG: polyphenol oxidase family protein [Leptospiraceae bacterium]|nr:polyphenol oxidase family protein [Leptospiraceae bacterium]MCP5497366.1 polyphenol oxidase family protein [Leptospiraceae bacterium]
MIHQTFLTESSRKIHIQIFGKNDYDWKNPKIHDEPYKYYKEVIFSNTSIERIHTLKQVHGEKLYSVSELCNSEIQEGDGLYTEETNEVLMVRTADCMPIFFWSETGDIAGIIHSGWRGTLAGITEKSLLYLLEKYPSIKVFHVYIGPCISQKNYEVQKDLVNMFSQKCSESIVSQNKKYYLSMEKFVIFQLKKSQIPFTLKKASVCTKDDPNYFSHRGGDSGRNLNCIYMTP